MRHLLLVFICLLPAFGAGEPVLGDTGHEPQDSATSAPATYEVTGVLREVRAGGSRALISHEAIPGFMDAMTMEFTVKNREGLAGFKPGDGLGFRLSVTPDRGWIDRIHRSGKSENSPEAASLKTPELIHPGDRLPDCPLISQSGASLRLGDFKGKALAVTFIFTRCPFPDFCPRMNRNLAAVQSALSSHEKTRAKCHLVSISIDPEFDTPDRLEAYARRYQANPMDWTFATGTVGDIEKLATAAGVTIRREGQQLNHNLRTLVIDSAGRLQRVFVGNEWRAEELVDELESASTADLPIRTTLH